MCRQKGGLLFFVCQNASFAPYSRGQTALFLWEKREKEADQILKGTPVSEVPAKVVDVFTTVINQNTADAIGASLSDDVKASAVLVEDSAQ